MWILCWRYFSSYLNKHLVVRYSIEESVFKVTLWVQFLHEGICLSLFSEPSTESWYVFLIGQFSKWCQLRTLLMACFQGTQTNAFLWKLYGRLPIYRQIRSSSNEIRQSLMDKPNCGYDEYPRQARCSQFWRSDLTMRYLASLYMPPNIYINKA